LLQIIFPEFSKHFDQHYLWLLSFSLHVHTVHIARIHINTLVKIIKIKGYRYATETLFNPLAKETFVYTSFPNEILINSIIENIKHFNK